MMEYLLNEEKIFTLIDNYKKTLKKELISSFGNTLDIKRIDEIVRDTSANLHTEICQYNDDFKSFINDTEGEDELQVILRGHLYIERELTEALKIILQEPEELLTNRFMFANKLKLAVALGIIPKEVKMPYEKVNNLRNKYAHTLNFAITDKDFDELYSLTNNKISPNNIGYAFSVEFDNESLINKMRTLIAILWINIKFILIALPMQLESQKLKIQIYEKQEMLKKLDKSRQ